MRASEILSRARRPVVPLPVAASASPAPAPPILARAEPQQVEVRPPQIPPLAPPPKSGVYRQLMKQHDRMGTRHLHRP